MPKISRMVKNLIWLRPKCHTCQKSDAKICANYAIIRPKICRVVKIIFESQITLALCQNLDYARSNQNYERCGIVVISMLSLINY